MSSRSTITVIEDDFIDREELRRKENELKRGPSRAEIESRETDRLERRKEIKLEIAAGEIAAERILELRRQIAAIEAEKDTSVAEHASKCQPIQRELAEVEAKQIALVASKKPTDSRLQRRHSELLVQLREANSELEDSVLTRDRLIARLTSEIRGLAERSNQTMAVSDLVSSGRSDLKIKLRVAQRSLTLAERRVSEANEQRSRWPPDYFQAEMAEAERLRDESQQRCDMAYDEIISE